MEPGNFMTTGFWIIPMTICVIFMLVMLFTRMRGGMGPHGFMSWQTPTAGNDVNSGSPLEIISKRYARGEISKSEYEQLKSDLTK